jgi:DNA-binding transcriptional MocR family regulator
LDTIVVRQHGNIGLMMAGPIRDPVAGPAIAAGQLADLLGRWSSAPGPLFRRLATRLQELTETGELPPGTRLPAERRLAQALAVSRNTVAAAYQQLRDTGVAETRRGAGTMLAPPRPAIAGAHRTNALFTSLLERHPAALDLTCAAPSCPPLVAQVLARPADMLPAPLAAQLCDGIGYHPAGTPLLREAVADHLSGLGLPTGPDQILITTGAQQAIDLLARAYLTAGDAVAVEQVTYPGILDAITRAGGRCLSLPLTEHGVAVDAVARALDLHRPRLVYLIPTFQNPTGRLLGDHDRRALVDLADRHPHTTIIDDYVLGELDHTSPAPAPLAALAPDRGNLLTVGSLSKLYWGGLRMGWLRAPTGVIRRLAATKAAADLGSNAPGQIVAAHLLRTQHTQLRRWRIRQLAAALDTLTGALARWLPDWQWQRPCGGQTLWVRLPGIDARGFAQTALRHGIAVIPQPLLSPDPGGGDHLRMPFVAPADQLVQAVQRLADAWTAHLRQRNQHHQS